MFVFYLRDLGPISTDKHADIKWEISIDMKTSRAFEIYGKEWGLFTNHVSQ